VPTAQRGSELSSTSSRGGMASPVSALCAVQNGARNQWPIASPEPMAHCKPRAQRGRRGHERTYALGCRCAAVLAPSVSLRRPVAFDRDCHRRSAGCWRPLQIEIRNPPPCWYSIKNGWTTLFLLPEGPMIDTMGPVAHKSGGHWRGSRSCTAIAIPPNGCWSRHQSRRFARVVAGPPCQASSSTRQHNDAVAPRREPPCQEYPS